MEFGSYEQQKEDLTVMYTAERGFLDQYLERGERVNARNATDRLIDLHHQLEDLENEHKRGEI